MIIAVDNQSREVYFISDSVKRMSFKQASEILSSIPEEIVSVLPIQSMSAGELVAIIGGNDFGLGNAVVVRESATVQNQVVSDKGKYMVPARAAAIVVSGLNPPLKFDNGYDYKSIDFIKSTYGGEIPHSLQRLVESGKIKIIDHTQVGEIEEKKKENVKFSQRKHKNGGRKIDSGDSYDDGDDDGGDDRILRKATRINL